MDLIAAEQIAKVALYHYHHVLPNKGKPKENEWTVYAAIVATTTTALAAASTTSSSSSTSPRCWVVSCATGTKCTAVHNSLPVPLQKEKGVQQEHQQDYYDYSSSILHDSHAEVLCRRGLIRVLIIEIQRKIQQMQQEQQEEKDDDHHTTNGEQHDDLLEIIDNNSNNINPITCFRLRHDIQLHLYVSDSPCGDASIYSINNVEKNNNNYERNHAATEDRNNQATTTTFTGAKVIMSQGGDNKSVMTQLLTNSHDDDSNDDSIDGSGDKQQATTAAATASAGNNQQPLPTTISNISSNSSGNADISTSNSITHHHHVVIIAREPKTQLLSMLRTKSGRSNIHPSNRSLSMSCSDKIVRWCVLGLQGALLSSSFFIPYPIRFTSCITSRDPRTTSTILSSFNKNSQLQALQRAIPDRIAAVHASLIQHCCCNKELMDAANRGGGTDCDEKETSSSSSSSSNDDNDTHNNNIRSCCRNNNIIQEFVKHLSTSIPAVFVVDSNFPRGKSVMEFEKIKSSSNNKSCITSSCGMNNTRKRKHSGNNDPHLPANATATKKSSLSSCSSTGLCINWNCAEASRKQDDVVVELTVGARGTRHGKKPKTARDYNLLESRLCRNQIRLLLSNLSSSSSSNSPMISTSTLPPKQLQSQQQQQQQHTQNTMKDDNDDTQSAMSSMSCYKTWKRSLVSPSYYQIRQEIFQHGPLKGWLVGGGGEQPLVLLDTTAVDKSSSHECCQQQQETTTTTSTI